MKAETGRFTLTGGDVVMTVTRVADLEPALQQREKPVAIKNVWLHRSLLALQFAWKGRRLLGPILRFVFRKYGLPEDFFDVWEMVVQDGTLYLVPTVAASTQEHNHADEQ